MVVRGGANWRRDHDETLCSKLPCITGLENLNCRPNDIRFSHADHRRYYYVAPQRITSQATLSYLRGLRRLLLALQHVGKWKYEYDGWLFMLRLDRLPC